MQVRAPETFLNKTFWPTYLAFTAELESHLRELTDRVIREAIKFRNADPNGMHKGHDLWLAKLKLVSEKRT